ncbi:MAG: tRNA (adenosine(37)-N6)-threonylcarbamoyltransferase complex ATPase subunit type 1 TsaE [Micrococcaceae bacterium]
MKVSVHSVEQTQALAEIVGKQLQAGDVLILHGDLGAGKTTFTQGLARGLGVREGIISPTFVIARRHPSLSNGAHLVHVDAYRLNSVDELYDLDIESELEDSVVVAEWGKGFVEELAEDYFTITLDRSSTDGEDDRIITIEGPSVTVSKINAAYLSSKQ